MSFPKLRHAAVISTIALSSLALVTGCASDAAPDDAAERTKVDQGFCKGVADFVAASKDGDLVGMADALESTQEHLPGEVAKDVDAYIDTLQLSPPNGTPDADHVEAEAAKRGFQRYARKTCGQDALDGQSFPDNSTTTSTASTSTTSTSTTQPGTGGTTLVPNSNSNDGSDGYTNGDADQSDDGDDVAN